MDRITDDIYALTGDLFMGLMYFPLRMLVIRLPAGLVVWSPIELDDAQAAAIDALGTVRWIIAPNAFHHLHLGAAMRRWPDAALIAPEGLAEKRLDLDLSAATRLASPPAEFAGILEARRIDGAAQMNEWVLLHTPSKTLIVCDLIFNIHAVKRWSASLIFRLVGAWKRCAQSRMWRLFVKDHSAAAASLAVVMAWDFDRLVMAHGDVIETGGQAALAQATPWMQAGKKRLDAPATGG